MISGLITIATGEAYRTYAQGMIDSALAFWHGGAFDPIVFTDDVSSFQKFESDNARVFYTEPKGFPNETLFRYHTMLSAEKELAQYDHLYYIDADMMFVADVGYEVFHDGVVGVLHPGYVGKKGTPELRGESTAYNPDGFAYYAGGFQGGKATWYLDAMRTMNERITEDAVNNITAIWHDESHWNRYLADVEHLMPQMVKRLTPSYCYPENYDGGYGWTTLDYPPILTCLTKPKAVRGKR